MDIARLGIEIDSRQAVAAGRDLDRLKGAASRSEKSVRTLGATAAVASRAFQILAGGVIAIAGRQMLDASIRIDNALKVAGLRGDALAAVYDRLFQSAQRNVAPVEALVQLYSRASLVQGELGISTDELLGFTDKVAVALRVSGRNAQESSGALLQLSQALGSGIVRAEEFNSILEGALPIAQAAAAGLEEAGGSVSKLRALVVDGKVSSEAFFRAFEAGSVILDSKVAGAELTVSQGFVRLQNVLIDAAGKFDETTGTSRLLAGALGAVADRIQDISSNLQNLKNAPFISETGTLLGWLGKIPEFLAKIDDGPPGNSAMKAIIRDGEIAIGKVEALKQLTASLGATAKAGRPAGDSASSRFDVAFGTPDPVSLSKYKVSGATDSAQKAIDKVKAALAFEEAQLTRTSREQAIYNRLNEAGVTITSAYGEQIAGAAGRVYDLATRMEAVREIGGGFFQDLRRELFNGGDAWKAFASSALSAIDRISERLLNSALDDGIASLFSGGGSSAGNFLGSLFGGFRAGGGGVTAGRAYVVGERGPEVFAPGMSGTILPAGAGGGAGPNVTIINNVDGADASAVAAIEQRLEIMAETIKPQIENAWREMRANRPELARG